MNFFVLLLLLPLGSCENCPVTLHETLKKDFSFDECGDCLIPGPGNSSEGKNWAGFCSGNRFFLFQNWKCREDNDLLNKTDYVVLGSNELCELVDEEHALNRECLKKFNSEICSQLSGSADLGRGDVKDGVDEVSFHVPRLTPPPFTSKTPGTTPTTTTTNPTTTSSACSTQGVVTKPPPPRGGDCEPNEFFFNFHCYSIKSYNDSRYEPPLVGNTREHASSINFFNVTESCQRLHPKALGLAVETIEEKDFILEMVHSRGELSKEIVILSSGIRWGNTSSKPDEWMDWGVEVNQSIIRVNSSQHPSKEIYHYGLGHDPNFWLLFNYVEQNEMFTLTICERPYNPKNTVLELHQICLKYYRASHCYNPERQTNFCCAKDDEGVIWFACPNTTQNMSFNDSTCTWTCGKDGFFENDRPLCRGYLTCRRFYNGISYVTSATRYAIGGCPRGFSGFSTWFCRKNGTYVGTPDYSLCCEDLAPQCKDTDAFLNVWAGCPSRKTSKKVACPPGSSVKAAAVEWFCDKNGSFSGSSPDFSKCNNSNNSQPACRQTDRFGREWWALFNTTQKKDCPVGFRGSCFWKCEENGTFDGPEPDCSKCKAPWMEKIDEKIKNNSSHVEVMQIMENHTRTDDLRVGYGHVLNLTSDCVSLFKKQIPQNEIQVFDNFLKSYSRIFKNVATKPIIWSSFSVTKREEYARQILNTTQNAAFAVLNPKNSPLQTYNVTLAKTKTDGFDFFVAYGPSVGSRFPLENPSESDWHLDIKQINDSNPTLAAMGLVMNYSLTSYMFPSGIETEDLALNAPAITFTVAEAVNGDVVFDPNVVVSISFKHTNRTKFPATQVIKRRLHNGEQPSGVFKSTVCCYYRNFNWSAEGCSVTYTSKDRTNCTCSHLSTIGLLMSIHKYVPDKTMELMSVLSSGITIVSLVLAILVFFFLDNAKNERVLIGKNLCFCLLVGHLMLLTVLDKKFFNIPEVLCTVSAALLHYVFTAAFAWMFVEGCHLYRMLVLVFDSGIEYRRVYLGIGYGAPVVVVGMTALVGFLSKDEPYGQDEFCWLKPPNYVWAFVGPVIVTTSVNLCILVMATKLAISSRRRIQNSNPNGPKSMFVGEKGIWFKGWISLSTLLGITWFFGLAYIHYNEGLAYAFILFNGLQGFFIFLFRCVLCEQYKNFFLKKMKSWFFKSNSADRKKCDAVRSETKLCAVSATKSSAETEGRDSGCDLGTEDGKVLYKPDRSSSSARTERVGSIETNNINSGNLILKFNLAKTGDPDNYPELSYHNNFN